jgi:hypothetical protein
MDNGKEESASVAVSITPDIPSDADSFPDISRAASLAPDMSFWDSENPAASLSPEVLPE